MTDARTRARAAYERRQRDAGGMVVKLRLPPGQAARVRALMTEEGLTAPEAVRRLLG